MRAQSALEFLVTYGWAFLVILIMIGSLSYFGVLDVGKLVPPSCLFNQGLYCVEHLVKAGPVYGVAGARVGEDSTRIIIRNSLGRPIDLAGSQFHISGSSTCTTLWPIFVGPPGFMENEIPPVQLHNTSTYIYTLNANEDVEIIMGCDDPTTITSGEKIDIKIDLKYSFVGSSLQRTALGHIRGVAR